VVEGSEKLVLVGPKGSVYLDCGVIIANRHIHLTPEYAEKIDLYFSKFGYACNKVKVPNISARPIYNYVKTNNCLVTGDANADVLKRIQGIFDAGVTFWKNAAYFGLYDAPGEDNSPQ
jgi:hypothetical protein